MFFFYLSLPHHQKWCCTKYLHGNPFNKGSSSHVELINKNLTQLMVLSDNWCNKSVVLQPRKLANVWRDNSLWPNLWISNFFFFFRGPNISVHTAKLYFYHILSTGLIHVRLSDLHSNKILSPFQNFHVFKKIQNSEAQQFSSCISYCCRVLLIEILMSVTFSDSKPDKAMCRLAHTSKPWRWSSHDTSSWTV